MPFILSLEGAIASVTYTTDFSLLVGEYPPQIHIKPALDVQKMENVQTCLDFLQHHNVSVNNIAAEGKK